MHKCECFTGVWHFLVAEILYVGTLIESKDHLKTSFVYLRCLKGSYELYLAT